MDNYSGSPVGAPPDSPQGEGRPGPGPWGPGRTSFFALFLIAIGALMFLDNLGFIPNIRPYWPLAISAFGVAQLVRPHRPCSFIWPIFMIFAGVLITLGNLHILHAGMSTLWPVFLIALGLSMLFRRDRQDWRCRRRWRPDSLNVAASVGGRFHGNILRENAVFSGVNRRVETPNFEGAELTAAFGELKVDLRAATISTPSREAIIETNASFGAIKLRIPETWKVLVQGGAVFGAYEDRTVPPRPDPGVKPPTVIIRGNAAFGAVEIEN